MSLFITNKIASPISKTTTNQQYQLMTLGIRNLGIKESDKTSTSLFKRFQLKALPTISPQINRMRVWFYPKEIFTLAKNSPRFSMRRGDYLSTSVIT